MPANKRLEGQIALITGASRGIGRVMARAFAAEGAAVAVLSRDVNEAKRVADEIAASAGRALPLAGDVSKEEDVRRFVTQTETSLGPVDVLVNNAGIPGPTAPATEITAADFERVLAVNLTGAFLCSREVLKGMVRRAQDARQQGRSHVAGRIINIGSIAGKISYPQRTPYASSKWGLIGLTMTLAEEVGPLGIRVNCICPGPVQTEMLEGVMQARAKATGIPVEAVREGFVAFTMLKRMVQPEDVARLALFLASDDGANLTGQAIDLSAGMASVPGIMAQLNRRPGP